MVTKFVLRTDKKDSTGRCPVHLMVLFDNQRLKCATGEKCKPDEWNADKQVFRKAYPLAEEANLLLSRLTTDVLTWWRELRAAGGQPTLAGLKAVLKPETAPILPAPVLRPMTELYEEYRQALRARGYSRETLRQRLVSHLTPPSPDQIQAWGSMIIQALVAIVTVWATIRKALQKPEAVVKVPAGTVAAVAAPAAATVTVQPASPSSDANSAH